jgi:type II secretory pathway pseudopilin PulG
VKRSKAFTLIELVLAITILLGIIGAIVINYDSLVGNTRYFEARENLKTYLINLKYQSAFQQKEFELTFDPDYNMYSSFEDFYLLDAVTNDLKILETSATKIVFFLDGSVQESYIVTSDLEGTITNKFIINVIGEVKYESYTNDIIENKESEVQTE